MRISSVFAMLVLAQMSSAWVRFREPYSRRNFLNQTLLEKLQNCAGKEVHECGLCGEGVGEVQTNVIATENYTVVDPDVRVLAVDLGFRAGLNGYLEFRVCNVTDNSTADGIACNKTTPLLIGSEVKWYPALNQSSAKSRFRLPRGLVCERCVLQVKYTPGPNSTMKDFRFFDCALLNITHPTKVMTETILTSQEIPPRDVFPPDHSVLDRRHVSTEFRSVNTVRGHGTDKRQQSHLNRTFTAKRNSQTDDRNNQIVSDTRTVEQGGPRVILSRLPSGERTASLFIGNVQSGGEALIKPVATSNISDRVIDDRRVIITTSMLNVTTNNLNANQSKGSNLARITMIDIQQNNVSATNNNNMAENELNGAANVESIKSKSIKGTEFVNADRSVKTIAVSKNDVENSLNRSVNTVNVNTVIRNTSNAFISTGTAKQEKHNLSATSGMDIKRTLVNITQSKILGMNTDTVVGQTSQTVRVDWRIYNNDSGNYYDDTYYNYNDTGIYNDTYYYNDYGFNNTETFTSNIADPKPSIPNIANDGPLSGAANIGIVRNNATDITNKSSTGGSARINSNISTGASLNSNRTVFGENFITKSETSLNVNNEVPGRNIETKSGSLGINTATNTDARLEMNSEVSSGNSTNANFINNFEVLNNNMVQSSDIGSVGDSVALNSNAIKTLDLSSSVNNEMTRANVKESTITVTGTNNRMSETDFATVAESADTNRKRLLQNYTVTDHGVFNKSSLINETVKMMADLTERPVTKLKSGMILDKSVVSVMNATAVDTHMDVNTDRINQQIVSVPHTIIVLPKSNTLTRPGQFSELTDSSSITMQKISLPHGDLKTNQDDLRTRTENYTTKEAVSSIVSANQTQENVFQRIEFDKTGEGHTAEIAANSIEDVPKDKIGIETHRRNYVDAPANITSDSSDYLRKSANSSPVSKSEINTFDEVTSNNKTELFDFNAPGQQATKRLFYAISAADRRPYYASKDAVRSSVDIDPVDSNVQTSFKSFNSRTNDTFSEAIGSDKATRTGTFGSVSPRETRTENTGPFRPIDIGIETTGSVRPTETKIDTLGPVRPIETRTDTIGSVRTIETRKENVGSVMPIEIRTNTVGSVRPVETRTETIGSGRHIGTGENFLGRVYTNAETLNSDTLILGPNETQENFNRFRHNLLTSSQTQQHAIKGKNDITGNSLNAWGVQSSNIDTSNQMFDRISSQISETTTNFPATSMSPVQETVTTSDNNVMLGISTRTYDQTKSRTHITGSKLQAWEVQSSNIGMSNQLFDGIGTQTSESMTNHQTASLPPLQKSVTTTDKNVMLDVSTRAYDQYIGLPSTTPEPLDMLGSTFVRLVNYSSVTADSIFPAPKQSTSSSSDSSPSESRSSTEASLMSIFSSTPAPKRTAVIPLEAPAVSIHEHSVAENNNLFAHLNFLADSEASVDHLGGVPILNGKKKVGGSQWESSFAVAGNNQQGNTASDTFTSTANFDILNTLDGAKYFLKDKASNEVVWKAPVEGFAIPVGNFSIDPDLRAEKSINGTITSAKSDILQTNKSESGDQLITPVVSVYDNSRRNKSNKFVTGKTIVWQSMHLSNLSNADKNESIINVPLPLDTASKSVRKLDISINGISGTKTSNVNDSLLSDQVLTAAPKLDISINGAAGKKESNINGVLPSDKVLTSTGKLDISINGDALINKIASTKKEGALGVITRITNVPDVMPPIEAKTEIPNVWYKIRNLRDKNLNKLPSATMLTKSKRNITFFNPNLINADNSNRLGIHRIRHVMINGKAKQNEAQGGGMNAKASHTVSRIHNKSLGGKTISNNLSVSSIWDINRGNTVEKASNVPQTVPASGVSNGYTVYSLGDNSNIDVFNSKQNVKSSMNVINDSRDAVVVEERSQNDVNKQVLRTLEALVLELEAMEMKAKKTRKPVVDSSVYRSTIDRAINRGGIHNSYPLFRVHPNLLTLPNGHMNEHVNRHFNRETAGGLRGSENHKLLNMLGISNKREWNSDINFKSTSIGADNINDTIDRNRSTQQIVNLSGVRSKAADQFATLLNSFADVSTGRAPMNRHMNDIKPVVVRKTSLQKTDITKDITAVNESRDQLTEMVIPFGSRKNDSFDKRQTVIRATGSTILNPFTGENINYSRPDKQFANKFIVRGIGNLQHLKNVEGLYSSNFSPNFTVANYNFTPVSSLSDVISIEGKYLQGQMRRNEMGQFEPVPLASSFDASAAEGRPPSTIKLSTKEDTVTNSANMMPMTRAANVRLPEDISSANIRQTANDRDRFVLSNIITGAGTNVLDVFNMFKDNSSKQTNNTNNNNFSRTNIEQNVIVKSQKYPVKSKIFFNQDDLLKTNGISLNQQTKTLTDTAAGTSNVRSEFWEDRLICKPEETLVCKAVGKNRHIPGMVWWCFSHCKNGVCPQEKCTCRCEKVRTVQKLNSTDSTNVSGSKRRNKVIHLTLNSPAKVSAPISESSSRRSESLLTEIIRPKVLNATVNNVEQKHSASKDRDKVVPVELFQTPPVKCVGINAFVNTAGIDELCTKICSQNMCPETICQCFT